MVGAEEGPEGESGALESGSDTSVPSSGFHEPGTERSEALGWLETL